MLDKIDPIILACTISISPLTSAKMAISSSIALLSISQGSMKGSAGTYPKVAFKRPPHASPNRRATSSVAKASPPASGSTLNRQTTKTTTSDWPVLASAQAMGRRTGAKQMIGHPLTVFYSLVVYGSRLMVSLTMADCFHEMNGKTGSSSSSSW
jgi:hypothetical protein